jgi:hypothetical protein
MLVIDRMFSEIWGRAEARGALLFLYRYKHRQNNLCRSIYADLRGDLLVCVMLEQHNIEHIIAQVGILQ